MEISSTVNESSNYDAGLAAYHRGHYEVAMYDFESRAIKGDPVAQFCLGFMYKHGKGVPHNREKAIAWYTKAAEQGYAPAQNDLGVMYLRLWEEPVLLGERSVNMDFLTLALEWFDRATQQNNPTAQFNLASVYAQNAASLERFGESQRIMELYQQVEIWYKKAAEQDYAPAQFHLAMMMYEEGLFEVDADFEKAVELYTKAASPDLETTTPYKQGYALAQHQLALMYHTGKGVKQDIKKAAKWYQRAAEQGLAESQFSLGLLYQMGNEVNQDFKEAEKWYQEAAEQGFARAQNNLAEMCEASGEVHKNPEKVLRLLFGAAQQGYALSQSSLGRVFEGGLFGVPKDKVEAYYWYSLAANDKIRLDEAVEDNMVAKVAARRETVGSMLTEEERNEIQKQVDNWKPKRLVSAGTGFYINKTHVLTNAHVVRRADERGRLVHEYDEVRINFRYVEEKSRSVDPEVDLALLVDRRGNTDDVATFRSYPVDFGEDIVVFGYPLSNVLSYRGNGTSGIVSGLTSTIDDSQPDNLFQHTAPIQEGNSGGPVLDSAGNVVGVVASSLNPNFVWHQNVNFAIKFNVIAEFLNQNEADYVTFQQMIISGENATIIHRKTAAINKEEIYVRSEKFTVPVLCFMNKRMESPLPVEEIGIDGLKL